MWCSSIVSQQRTRSPTRSLAQVSVKEIGGRKVTIFHQEKEDTRVATIILRASTDNLLNDLERAVDGKCEGYTV